MPHRPRGRSRSYASRAPSQIDQFDSFCINQRARIEGRLAESYERVHATRNDGLSRTDVLREHLVQQQGPNHATGQKKKGCE